MLRKAFFLALLTVLLSLALSSKAQAWGAYHVGYTHYSPYTGVHHYGYTTAHTGGYGGGSGGAHYGYHYGSTGYGGGYHYGYHYGGSGGSASYHYGYARRW
jgi:hypothetical protein